MALLEVRDLSRHFGGLAVVDGLSFGVEEGEICGLVRTFQSMALFQEFSVRETGRVVLDGAAIERRGRAHVRKAYLGG